MKYKYRKIWGLAIFFLVFFAGNVFGQVFGQNKVQYDLFNWNILTTPHYEIYYYSGGERLAIIAAEIAEKSYHKLENDLKHTVAKKVPIILYRSHNDFKQTNVILELISEGTGGFTEIFRTRVVVPFTGSYADFEHVLTHELVHVFHVDMLYGSILNSKMGAGTLYQIPLWFIEGTAEYFSNPWGYDEDIFMRDAVIAGYLVPLEYLEYVGGYIIYKEGQSVLKHIEEKYGYEKILELNRNLKTSRDFSKALEMTLGVDLKKLDEEWQRWLKRRYWPDLVDRKEPSEFAKKMTDHTEDDSYINMAPALSPDGDKLAFISDKEQYTNIFLMSAIDGEILATLVKGERSEDFEYLHSFKTQISWSPDSRYISFSAKSGDQDALFIFDVRKKDVVKKFKFDLDGLYSPSWSPDGDKIVFVGLKDAKSDLYILSDVQNIIEEDLEDYPLERVMNDEWADTQPAWSNDGKYIAFASDRPKDELNLEFSNFGFGQYDIFLLNVETREIERIISDPATEKFPSWLPQGNKLGFVSDRDGAENLYVYDLEADSLVQFTNVLGSVLTPSWSMNTDRLVFSSFNQGGWDIFLLNESMDLLKEEEEQDTIVAEAVDIPVREVSDSLLVIEPLKPELISQDSVKQSILEELGKRYRTRKYKTKFAFDAVGGGVSYHTIGSFYAMSEVHLSDILGDHRIAFGLSAFGNSLKEADAFGYYYYLPRKTDYGMGIFHFKNYYYSNKTIFGEYFEKDLPYSERTYGLDFAVSHPFDRYRRVDFSLRAMNVERDLYRYYGGYVYEKYKTEHMKIFQFGLAFSTDNTLWGQVGPVNGSRYYLLSENTLFSDLDYQTIIGEYRRYIPLFAGSSFAVRALGAVSYGDEAQVFHLGGSETLRGYDYEEVSGTRAGLLNVEFRYPFIDYLAFVFPLPLHFQYIRGVTFFDLGSAWYNTDSWKGGETRKDDNPRLKDLKASWGVGCRMRLAYYVLKFDVGWGTDFSSQTEEEYHFSLGAEF